MNEHNIISDTTVTNESTLLQADQARDDGLHTPDEDPRTYFVEFSTKADLFEMARDRCIRSFRDKSDEGLLPLLR